MSQEWKAGWLWDAIRNFCSIFDRIAYLILVLVYQIFFQVASATIISGDTIRAFFGRIQLILGILIMFKLAISLISGIVNPDELVDKEKGFSKIITRIIMALVMLTLIVPVNIPNAESSYEININNNGILFGTLYEFQTRVLNQNVLGKLIIGSTYSSTYDTTSEDSEAGSMKNSANLMASTVLKAFIRINLKPASERNDDDETKKANRMCGEDSVDERAIDTYIAGNSDPQLILDNINLSCGKWNAFKENRYVFAYLPIISAVIGGLFAFILIGFTVDVAIRAIKLAVLRLIAPIPIISYIDPKSSKDGAFAAWVKAVTSTYLDLFMRLAIVYFAVFLVQQIAIHGIVMNFGESFLVNAFAVVFVFLGIFFFARMAPKFIMDAMGIKPGSMGNVGLSGILGGTAMAIGGGGLKGFALGGMQGANNSVEATSQGKAFSPMDSWGQNRDQMAKIRTGDKDARGGIYGGTMDRLLYGARERQLGKKGLTDTNKELSKNAYYAQQAVVSNAQNERDLAFEKLKNAQNSRDEASRNFDEKTLPEYQKLQAELNYQGADKEQRVAQAKQNLTMAKQRFTDSINRDVEIARKDFNDKDGILAAEQTTLGKQEKQYKNISEARSASGVDPRLIDEYTAHSYRAGGKGTKFTPDIRNSDTQPADSTDDMGGDRLGGEIGGSGGPRGPR